MNKLLEHIESDIEVAEELLEDGENADEFFKLAIAKSLLVIATELKDLNERVKLNGIDVNNIS